MPAFGRSGVFSHSLEERRAVQVCWSIGTGSRRRGFAHPPFDDRPQAEAVPPAESRLNGAATVSGDGIIKSNGKSPKADGRLNNP